MAIITISRGTKSGGLALAQCLAQTLEYPMVGHEVIEEAASALGVTEEALDHTMQDAPKLWDRDPATQKVYLAAVRAALAEHVAEGNLVYHGLAGQLLLKNLPAVLRVRLIAPVESRVRTLMEQRQMDQAAAEQYINHVDEHRSRWVKAMYGEHIDDPALYDMVINLETMSVPVACKLVAATIKRPEFAITPEVKTKLEDFLLACRVKAALASTAETRALDLEVEAERGVVHMTGGAPKFATVRMQDYITLITRCVPGVEDTQLKVQWFDRYP